MMEPISFILGVAGSVLGGVITDLITGKSAATRRSEIEKEVANQLIRKHHRQSCEDTQIVLRKIMDEIMILSSRDCDLVVYEDEIKLKSPIKKKYFHNEEKVRKELSEKIEKLDKIISARREELLLPIKPVEELQHELFLQLTNLDKIAKEKRLRLGLPIQTDEVKCQTSRDLSVKQKEESISVSWKNRNNIEKEALDQFNNDTIPVNWKSIK